MTRRAGLGQLRAERVVAPAPVGRLAVGPATFDLLTRLAARRERIAYADFAFELGLGSPRSLGWLLSPLLGWCRNAGLPWLPIIVVRRADGLPSGGYEDAAVATETERVFAHSWPGTAPPQSADLLPFVVHSADEAGPSRC